MTFLTLIELSSLLFATGLGSYVLIAIKRINEIENEYRDLVRVVRELAPLQSAHQRNKTEIAIIKHRLLDIERYLEKSGFCPVPFDENSFL